MILDPLRKSPSSPPGSNCIFFIAKGHAVVVVSGWFVWVGGLGKRNGKILEFGFFLSGQQIRAGRQFPRRPLTSFPNSHRKEQCKVLWLVKRRLAEKKNHQSTTCFQVPLKWSLSREHKPKRGGDRDSFPESFGFLKSLPQIFTAKTGWAISCEAKTGWGGRKV